MMAAMEHWQKTYDSDVDVYEAFDAAFDPGGLVWSRVLDLVPFAGKTVLEIGCGPGHYARAIAPTTMSYIALDISEAMIATAKERGAGIANLTFVRADAQDIPLPDASVDLIFGTWATGAIYPRAAKERAMAEFHRVLKPGGEIWAVETTWQSEFMNLRGPEERDNDHRPAAEAFGTTLVAVAAVWAEWVLLWLVEQRWLEASGSEWPAMVTSLRRAKCGSRGVQGSESISARFEPLLAAWT